MRIVSAPGRVRNEHFLMTADHLMMEVEPGTFKLRSAIAEGGIEVHLFGSPEGADFVVLAERATYDAQAQRLKLGGWKGTRLDGVESPPDFVAGEVVVPGDGTFFKMPVEQPLAA